MDRPATLTADALEQAMAELHSDWTVIDDKLRRELRFSSFARAFAFMAEIAIHAERLNHHPEWSNVYNRVTVDLTTHDLGGLSTLDVELAGHIDRAAASS